MVATFPSFALIPKVLSAKFSVEISKYCFGFALIPKVLSAKFVEFVKKPRDCFALIPKVLSAKSLRGNQVSGAALP